MRASLGLSLPFKSGNVLDGICPLLRARRRFLNEGKWEDPQTEPQVTAEI